MRGIPFDVNDPDLRAVFLGRLLAESLARLRRDDRVRAGGPRRAAPGGLSRAR